MFWLKDMGGLGAFFPLGNFTKPNPKKLLASYPKTGYTLLKPNSRCFALQSTGCSEVYVPTGPRGDLEQ